MRIFLFSIFLLFGLSIKAQTNSSILGKWKIISISNADIYYNFKTDSVAFFSELEEANKNLLAKEFAISVSKMFGDYIYYFARKGYLEEFHNNKSDAIGTYHVDTFGANFHYCVDNHDDISIFQTQTFTQVGNLARLYFINRLFVGTSRTIRYGYS